MACEVQQRRNVVRQSLQLWMLPLLGLCLASFGLRCDARAVNVSNTWTMPQEGLNVFYRFFRDRISWFEADAVCQFHHANLVTVDNSFQFDATRDLLRELDVNDIVWIGLMRPQNSERFMWSNSRPLVVDTGYWAESLPLMDAPLCAVIDPIRDYRWHALRCGGPETASFLCEMPVPSWADACILKEMPNLTMQYMADTASIELIRNCQEEGLLRHTCKGKEDREHALRELICPKERLEAQRINDITNSHFKSLQIINNIRTDNNENNDIELLPLVPNYAASIRQLEEATAASAPIERLTVDRMMLADGPMALAVAGYRIADEVPMPVKKSAKKMIAHDEHAKKLLAQQQTQLRKTTPMPLAALDMMMGDQPAVSEEQMPEDRSDSDSEVSNEIFVALPHHRKILPQDLRTMQPITEPAAETTAAAKTAGTTSEVVTTTKQPATAAATTTTQATLTSTTTTLTTTAMPATTTTAAPATTTTAAPATTTTTAMRATTTTTAAATTLPATTTAATTPVATTTTAAVIKRTEAPATTAATSTTRLEATNENIIKITTTTAAASAATDVETESYTTVVAAAGNNSDSNVSSASDNDGGNGNSNTGRTTNNNHTTNNNNNNATPSTVVWPMGLPTPVSIAHPIHPQQQPHDEMSHPHVKETVDNSHFIPPMLLVKSHYVPPARHGGEHFGEHKLASTTAAAAAAATTTTTTEAIATTAFTARHPSVAGVPGAATAPTAAAAVATATAAATDVTATAIGSAAMATTTSAEAEAAATAATSIPETTTAEAAGAMGTTAAKRAPNTEAPQLFKTAATKQPAANENRSNATTAAAAAATTATTTTTTAAAPMQPLGKMQLAREKATADMAAMWTGDGAEPEAEAEDELALTSATTRRNFLDEETEAAFKPNRRRSLTKPETVSYFKKILG